MSMSPLHVNFAPPSFLRAVAQTRPITWLFGCVGVALCVVAVVTSLALIGKNNVQKISLQKVEAQQAERASRKEPAKEFKIPDAQVFAINAAILQLNLPWSDVFDAIEQATPSTIALLALEPDAKKKIVKAMAEAKSSGDMIAYIEQLKKQPFFGNVVITKHEINEQDMNKPMRFQFEAQWKESM